MALKPFSKGNVTKDFIKSNVIKSINDSFKIFFPALQDSMIQMFVIIVKLVIDHLNKF